MQGDRKVVLGGGAALLLVAGLVALWMAGRPGGVDVVVADGPTVSRGVARDDEGLVTGRGAKAGRRHHRPRHLRRGGPPLGPNGQPVVPKEDTGPSGDEDTGVTREQLIDEMIEDVAQDTGLTDPEKTQMADALLHIRDAELEPTPETP